MRRDVIPVVPCLQLKKFENRQVPSLFRKFCERYKDAQFVYSNVDGEMKISHLVGKDGIKTDKYGNKHMRRVYLRVNNLESLSKKCKDKRCSYCACSILLTRKDNEGKNKKIWGQCSGCKKMKYCSRKCQKSHWAAGHKYRCKNK